MSDTQKMLRAIINGQSALKEELLQRIDGVEKKLDKRIEGLEKKTEKGFEEVNKRLDKIGSQVAYLEDDAPTREEYDKLENRVGKLEQKTAST
ncbi:MAG: hypothetical protein HYU80_03925 [Candidatus Blackburnbacteria bacterium]|nr:hypothetical protein [Candidatus Blackburnbacteria bacterium]